ncbi:hypothetical protein PTTG_25749 [Puccinia triticina 1-1 BBBD Race 1]|uniref:Uncharacterized protein n=1 Tax=Puccinia triticina (isolate 1-1 / race 1 (BBBD)) TaxID=630390 RepID=A0A180GZQ4_PUCT1|nr:hypothetical protein PTTG_25749 [Puccinia triticina 1-1 BBBD Race 1]
MPAKTSKNPATATTNTIQAQQRKSASQATLVVSRSKANLHKKRPNGLSRNSTSLSLAKPAPLSQQKKPGRTARKGAFKGALDPDPDDDQDSNNHHQPQSHTHTPSQDEASWVSEPSTRCTTPTLQQPLPNTDHLQLQLPNPLSPSSLLPDSPHHHPRPSTSQPTPTTPQPQPSTSQPEPSTSQPEPSTSQPEPSTSQPEPQPEPSPQRDTPLERPEPESRGRSKSRHRPHEDRSTRSEVSQHSGAHQAPLQTLPEPPDQQSPTRRDSLRSKGKGKASPGSSQKQAVSAKRSSINSVRSLSSLVIFHNDCLLRSSTSRTGLKRVDSSASVVLPPKIDTTEAVISLNGKATFNPTLMSISDFPAETLSTPNTALSSPVPTSSKAPFSTTLPDSPHAPSLQQPGHRAPSCSPSPARLDQSECARRLKKYSHVNRPSQLINMKAANDASVGLLSSLLSPGLTFAKSRRSGETSTGQQGPGYFDSFRSLVGMSTLLDPDEPAGPSSNKPEPGLDRPLRRSSGEPEPARPRTTAKREARSGISLNGVRYPFAQSQKLLGLPRPTLPKPAVPGLITTCGPQPVVSKFLGPRPTPPTTGGPPAGASASTQPSPSGAEPPATTETGGPAEPDPEEAAHGARSAHLAHPLRPPDPPCSPARPPSSSSTSAPLPPPSYLIRSLGGQTGPLPFIPFNLLPSDDPLPPSSLPHRASSSESSESANPRPSTLASQPGNADQPQRLNQPALKAKQALSIKIWRNSLIDEVEQVLTDHESNTRFRNPLFESLIRVASSDHPHHP